MKEKFGTVILFLIPFITFCQMNSSIDIVSGIDYSHRYLKSSNEDHIVQAILITREGESGKPNWRFGINFNQKFARKLFFKTGLRLISVGYKTKKRTNLRWPSEIDGTGMHTPDPSLPHEIQFIYNYWFTEIPLAVRFELNEKKLSPFCELGVSPSIYLTTKTISISDLTTKTSYQRGGRSSFNKIHFVAAFSFGINYLIMEGLQFFGQPSFRYHLTSSGDGPIGEHLYNIGIEIGLRKRLR